MSHLKQFFSLWSILQIFFFEGSLVELNKFKKLKKVFLNARTCSTQREMNIVFKENYSLKLFIAPKVASDKRNI